MIGASFLRAASRHALIPEEETQFTAGIAYPEKERKFGVSQVLVQNRNMITNGEKKFRGGGDDEKIRTTNYQV